MVIAICTTPTRLRQISNSCEACSNDVVVHVLGLRVVFETLTVLVTSYVWRLAPKLVRPLIEDAESLDLSSPICELRQSPWTSGAAVLVLIVGACAVYRSAKPAEISKNSSSFFQSTWLSAFGQDRKETRSRERQKATRQNIDEKTTLPSK